MTKLALSLAAIEGRLLNPANSVRLASLLHIFYDFLKISGKKIRDYFIWTSLSQLFPHRLGLKHAAGPEEERRIYLFIYFLWTSGPFGIFFLCHPPEDSLWSSSPIAGGNPPVDAVSHKLGRCRI
jgi:hypothetical protein